MNTTDPAPVPEDDDVPNDSWFARNVLWVMPLLFITPLAFFLCVCGGPVFFLLLDSQEREPWLTIMKTLRDSPEVRAKLGEPIDSASLVPLGQIQRTGENAASGMFKFSIKGPKDSASVFVQCDMLNDAWTIRRLDVRTRDQAVIHLGPEKGPRPGMWDADPLGGFAEPVSTAESTKPTKSTMDSKAAGTTSSAR